MAEGFRLRVCYTKLGRLRFLSHLELMRACERSVRRARLPYAVTKGFSPKMKVAFGPALPVGTAGEREYFDLWTTEHMSAESALERLSASTPEDMAPRHARYVAPSEPSLSAALTIARYRILVGGAGVEPQALKEALEEVRSRGTLQVEHKGKRKVFDLAESLPKEAEAESLDDSLQVDLTVRMGPSGSLRPEAVVSSAIALLDVQVGVESVTRTDLLAEEKDGWRRPL